MVVEDADEKEEVIVRGVLGWVVEEKWRWERKSDDSKGLELVMDDDDSTKALLLLLLMVVENKEQVGGGQVRYVAITVRTDRFAVVVK